MFLMLLGSAGTITVIGALFLSFANAEPAQRERRIAILIGALLLVWLLARSAWVDRRLSWLIARVLNRFTDIEARDYAALLRLSNRFAVMELAVAPGDWVVGKTLRRLDLRSEGVLVLGILRDDGDYVGVPRFDTRVAAGDTLIAYGASERLCELDRRPAGPEGDAAHAHAVAVSPRDGPAQRDAA